MASKSRPFGPFAVNDMVIKEDNCNMTCQYCLTGQSQFKERHAGRMVFQSPRLHACLPGTDLYARLHAVLDAVAWHGIPIVKISGGEVLLIRGILDFIEELSARHETVTVLTNGFLLTDRKLDRLRNLGNVVLQVSLDATCYRGNSYRVSSKKVQDGLMSRIQKILGSDLPVEIYTVLNDRSIETLEQTLDDLARHADHVTLFPFPVRGPMRDRFLPRPSQLTYLGRVIDRADRYNRLLPGRPYMTRLWRFLTEGARTFRCHLPRIAFSTFDDGTVTSCPNIWFDNVGNLFDEPAEDLFQRLVDMRFRQLLLAARPRIDACRACFSPWDVLTLYLDDELTLDALTSSPMYRGPRTRARLAEIRTAYADGRELPA